MSFTTLLSKLIFNLKTVEAEYLQEPTTHSSENQGDLDDPEIDKKIIKSVITLNYFYRSLKAL